MAMKAQTKRWLVAVSVASSLLVILFYIDRSTPATPFTRVAPVGHRLLPRSVQRSAAIAAPAPRPVADPVRERYTVQAASAVLRVGGAGD